MPIIATDKGGGDFEIPKAGSYIARCFKIIDIGTQPQTFAGKPSAPKRKIYMYWELLEDEDGAPYRMDDGQPFSVMESYTLSTNPKSTLRKHIDAWRGKALTKEEAEAFDVTVLLGKYCRLQVALDEREDRTWVKIASIGSTKKKPAGVNEEFWWSISEPDVGEFDKFPEWLQNKIRQAQEPLSLAVSMPNGPVSSGNSHISPKGETIIEDLDDDPINVDELQF